MPRLLQDVTPVSDPETFWDVNINDLNEQILHEQTGFADHPQRVLFRKFLREMGPVTMLDCGAGPAWELEGIEAEGLPVTYTGLDITERFAKAMEARGLEVIRASVNNIPVPNDTFDIVYSRHVMEHLFTVEAVKDAISEMVRVARRAVYICNHKDLTSQTTIVRRARTGVWHNVYSTKDFMAACALPSVKSVDSRGLNSFVLRLE